MPLIYVNTNIISTMNSQLQTLQIAVVKKGYVEANYKGNVKIPMAQSK